MAAKPAPSQERPLVTGEKSLPPKIAALVDDPILCSRIAGAWPALQAVGVAVVMELPRYCKKEGLDASATVLALNRLLTTLEVLKDQGEQDRRNAQKPVTRKP